MRVHRGEMRWPNGLAQIARVGKQSGYDQIASHLRLSHIPVIGSQGQQKEEHAQNVLALRGPGHRFDVNRMQGKKRSHRETSPRKTGWPLKDQEQQHRVDCVEQEIDVMMPVRIEPEQLTIQSVRKPSERMTVGLLA